MIRPALLALLLAVLAPAPGATQAGPGGRPLSADAEQNLQFGDVLGGFPHTVLRTDPAAAARIRITGERDTDVLVDFFLPPALTDGAGNALLLEFGPGDGGYSTGNGSDDQRPFDPRLPTVVSLPGDGRGALYLGGTVHPPADAPAGAYDATITLSYVDN